MRAKVPKCNSSALKTSISKLVDPCLSINTEPIPFTSEPVEFLGHMFGMFGPHQNLDNLKQKLSPSLQRMLDCVNVCPMSRKYKLSMYRLRVCSRLPWLLSIEDLPITWVKKALMLLLLGMLRNEQGWHGPQTQVFCIYRRRRVISIYHSSLLSINTYSMRQKKLSINDPFKAHPCYENEV